MIKFLVAASLLFAMTTQADAQQRRQRIVVYPSQPIYEDQRLIRRHPIFVELVLARIFCGFHVFSVGPEPKPGQLGACADYFNFSQPKQRRRA